MMWASIKRAEQPKMRTKEFVYDGFTLGTKKSGAIAARYARNCRCVNGVLTQAMGMTTYPLNGAAVYITPSLDAQFFSAVEVTSGGVKKERLGAISYLETAYLYNESTAKFSSIGTLYGGGSCVTALDQDGNYVNVVSCDLGMHQLRDGGLYLLASMKAQRATCVCGGRVFVAVDGFWLAYSAPYAPTDFSESVHDGGKIAMRSDCGKIVGLARLKHKLCVLYEYGISTLELAGTARSFVRKDFAYGGGKIFGESLCVGNCGGERAYFLAKDGVYAFDGGRVERICQNLVLSPLDSSTYYCGRAIVENTYFLTYMDADGQWRTVAVDLESGEGCETYTMRGLFAGESYAGFQMNNALQRIANGSGLPIGEEGVFTAEDTDFSMRGNKTLQTLRLRGEGSVVVQVVCGKKTKTQSVTMEEGEGVMTVQLRGERFTLTLKPQYGSKIRGLTAIVQAFK